MSAFDSLISISTSCISWLLFYKPITTIIPEKQGIHKVAYSWLTSGVWAIVLPSILIATDATNNSVTGEDDFINVKLVSVALGVLLISGFTSYSLIYDKNINNVVSIVLGLVLIVNILEATYTQIQNGIQDTNKKEKVVNIINGSIGAGLCLVLSYMMYKNRNDLITIPNGTLRINSNFGWYYILAYSFWNVLFRTQLVQNSAVLMFTVTSILLPMFTHYFGVGDWLQMRAYTLLATLIFIYGLTPDDRFLSRYIKDGYDPEEEKDLWIVKLQRSYYYKFSFLSLGMVFLILCIIRRVKHVL